MSLLSTLFLLAPRLAIDWRVALSGAFLATIFFMVARPIFLRYIQLFANYNLIYGSLAVVSDFIRSYFPRSRLFLYHFYLLLFAIPLPGPYHRENGCQSAHQGDKAQDNACDRQEGQCSRKGEA